MICGTDTFCNTFRLRTLVVAIAISLTGCSGSSDTPTSASAYPADIPTGYAASGMSMSATAVDANVALRSAGATTLVGQTEVGLSFRSNDPVRMEAVATSDASVSIDWDDVSSVGTYEVYRRDTPLNVFDDAVCFNDGDEAAVTGYVPIGTTGESKFIDATIEPTIRYEYMVVAADGPKRAKPVSPVLIVSLTEARGLMKKVNGAAAVVPGSAQAAPPAAAARPVTPAPTLGSEASPVEPPVASAPSLTGLPDKRPVTPNATPSRGVDAPRPDVEVPAAIEAERAEPPESVPSTPESVGQTTAPATKVPDETVEQGLQAETTVPAVQTLPTQPTSQVDTSEPVTQTPSTEPVAEIEATEIPTQALPTETVAQVEAAESIAEPPPTESVPQVETDELVTQTPPAASAGSAAENEDAREPAPTTQGAPCLPESTSESESDRHVEESAQDVDLPPPTIAVDASYPDIVTPSPGSRLEGSESSFTWKANGTVATRWFVKAGTDDDDDRYFSSGYISDADARVQSVAGLPTDGSTVVIELSYELANGDWMSREFRYTADSRDAATASADTATGAGAVDQPTSTAGTETQGAQSGSSSGETSETVAQIEMTSPAPGAVLSGSSIRFDWSVSDAEPLQWFVKAGTAAQQDRHYDSGRIEEGGTRHHVVDGLPTDGSELLVELSYKLPSGEWRSSRFSYTAAEGTGESVEVAAEEASEPQLGAARGAQSWDMSVEPPELDDPIEIALTHDYSIASIDDFDRVGCEGLIHRIEIPSGRDARITMAPGVTSIRYPVWVSGGRNVHIRGLEVRTEVQPGCDIGEAHQTRNDIPNIHPRLPGSKAFRLEQSGTTFIEGVDIDLRGQEADCFVVRNPPGMELEDVLRTRHVRIVNTRCTGIEGLDDSPIGDGIHGDFFQNQGRDNVASLIFENVTFLTSANGITHHDWNGSRGRPSLFKLRNLNYGWDLRYSADDPYEISGLAFVGVGHQVVFENVWLDHPRGANYGFINDERVGAFYQAGHIEKVDGLYEGPPGTGDFAPEDLTGVGYVSPWGN